MKIEKKHIPNILTIVRMIMVPIIVIFLLVPHGNVKPVYSISTAHIGTFVYWNYLIAAIFFVLACVTDWMDGYLARKYNWISNFGKLWDPIADKVLINSILICFAAKGWTPVWVPIIMIARDVVVDASRMHAASKNVVVAANIHGKLKTVAQMVGIIVIFFLFNMTSDYTVYYYGVQNLMIYVALLFSIVSGVIYLCNIYKKPKSEVVQ